MQELEFNCFQMISAAGAAKSDFVEAISQLKKGNASRAKELVEEGEKNYRKGHEAHAQLLKLRESAESINAMVLVMHAEDQLMGAELSKIMFKEFEEIYEKISKLEKEVKK